MTMHSILFDKKYEAALLCGENLSLLIRRCHYCSSNLFFSSIATCAPSPAAMIA